MGPACREQLRQSGEHGSGFQKVRPFHAFFTVNSGSGAQPQRGPGQRPGSWVGSGAADPSIIYGRHACVWRLA